MHQKPPFELKIKKNSGEGAEEAQPLPRHTPPPHTHNPLGAERDPRAYGARLDSRLRHSTSPRRASAQGRLPRVLWDPSDAPA